MGGPGSGPRKYGGMKGTAKIGRRKGQHRKGTNLARHQKEVRDLKNTSWKKNSEGKRYR